MSTSTKILMRLERHIRNPPVVRQHGSTSQTQQQGTDYPSQTIVSNFGTFLEFIISMLLMANLRYAITSDFDSSFDTFTFFQSITIHIRPHGSVRTVNCPCGMLPNLNQTTLSRPEVRYILQLPWISRPQATKLTQTF